MTRQVRHRLFAGLYVCLAALTAVTVLWSLLQGWAVYKLRQGVGDTWFYAARAPDAVEARPDGGECVDARWLTPAGALAAHAEDELALVFPTIKHLELLSETPSVEETLAAARARPVDPVLPKVEMRDGSPRILLPGEPGYDDA